MSKKNLWKQAKSVMVPVAERFRNEKGEWDVRSKLFSRRFIISVEPVEYKEVDPDGYDHPEEMPLVAPFVLWYRVVLEKHARNTYTYTDCSGSVKECDYFISGANPEHPLLEGSDFADYFGEPAYDDEWERMTSLLTEKVVNELCDADSKEIDEMYGPDDEVSVDTEQKRKEMREACQKFVDFVNDEMKPEWKFDPFQEEAENMKVR
jgi:hypothetical protein